MLSAGRRRGATSCGAVGDFAQTLDRFWAPGDGDGVHPPLTNATVSDVERTLRVRLPPDYLALLQVQNGGAVSGACNAFPLDLPDPWGAEFAWLPDLYGLGGPGVATSVQRSDDIHDPDWGPPEGLVLIASPDAGHQFLALDYRAGGPDGEPSVLWCDTEGPFVRDLAPSFRTFVEGLRPAESFPSSRPDPALLAAAAKRRRWPFGRRR
jgi:hypothetical protein